MAEVKTGGPVRVERADPGQEEARALLAASHAHMKALYPDDWCHVMSVEELRAPDVRFFLARLDGAARGCGALALRDGYGEVKSMYVDPAVRGAGLGRHLLARIEGEARAMGLPCLRLETGYDLGPALSLYDSAGFSRRSAFGTYPDVAESVFMEKRL